MRDIEGDWNMVGVSVVYFLTWGVDIKEMDVKKKRKKMMMLMLLDESVVVIRMFKAQICLCVYRRGEKDSRCPQLYVHTHRSDQTRQKKR